MKKIAGLILVFAMSFASVNVYASDSFVSTSVSDSYSSDTGHRIQEALADTLFSWTKVFSVPHAYSEEGKSPWAGAGKGVVDAVHCTFVGAFNLLTFPISAELNSDSCVDLDGGPGVPMTEDWEGARVPQ